MCGPTMYDRAYIGRIFSTPIFWLTGMTPHIENIYPISAACAAYYHSVFEKRYYGNMSKTRVYEAEKLNTVVKTMNCR